MTWEFQTHSVVTRNSLVGCTRRLLGLVIRINALVQQFNAGKLCRTLVTCGIEPFLVRRRPAVHP